MSMVSGSNQRRNANLNIYINLQQNGQGYNPPKRMQELKNLLKIFRVLVECIPWLYSLFTVLFSYSKYSNKEA